LPSGKTCPLNVCCSEFGFVSIMIPGARSENRNH
jgi:hypothetical protein